MQNSAQIEYDYSVAKCFTFTTILFGIIGMTIGVVLAFQLAFPELNYLAGEYGTFSRLRPLHTNGVAFGFTLSGVFCWLVLYISKGFKSFIKRVTFFNGSCKTSFLGIFYNYSYWL